MNLIFSAMLFGAVLGALVTAVGMTVDRGRAAGAQKKTERSVTTLPCYSVCPNCGAHLDPGERCDCQQELAVSAANNTNRKEHVQWTPQPAQA